MKRFVWSIGALAAVGLLMLPRATAAQGVTSAAIAGRITDEAGQPVPSALLTLTNGSSGQRYSARSREDGRYSLENVDVGGPYTLAVRALGFEPKTSTPFNLQLGQRFALDLSLKRAAVELAGVVVETQSNPLLSTARTGAGSFISDSALRRLPTLNRAFNDFVNTAPQIVKTPGGGTSFTGQNDRFNNIQIDGTVNNDLFALGASNQIPGGGVAWSKPGDRVLVGIEPRPLFVKAGKGLVGGSALPVTVVPVAPRMVEDHIQDDSQALRVRL